MRKWEHLTDDEIKVEAEKLYKKHNGEYLTVICPCGNAQCQPTGNTKLAVIKRICKECFEQ